MWVAFDTFLDKMEKPLESLVSAAITTQLSPAMAAAVLHSI